MRLAVWRKTESLTQAELADRLGVSQPHVSMMERAHDPAIPAPEVMRLIYLLSNGAVRPDDFYDLPPLPGSDADRQLALPSLDGALDQAA